MLFEGVAEGCVETVTPRFAIGMVALQQMMEIFGGGFAQGARVGRDGVVPVGKFGSGEYIVTKFYKLDVSRGHSVEGLLEGLEIDRLHCGAAPVVAGLDVLVEGWR